MAIFFYICIVELGNEILILISLIMMKATIKNFIELFEPTTQKILERTNAFYIEHDLEPITREKEIKYFKYNLISGFLRQVFVYVNQDDTIIDLDFRVGCDVNIVGYLKFERDNQQYYINTDCIFVEGEIQRAHYRYITTNTNAKVLVDKTRKESVKLIDKLYKYVIDSENTREGEDIKMYNNIINRKQEDINELLEIELDDEKLFEYWGKNISIKRVRKSDFFKGLYDFSNCGNFDYALKECYDSVGISEEEYNNDIEIRKHYTANYLRKGYELALTAKEFDDILIKKYIDLAYDEKAIKKTKSSIKRHIKSLEKEISKEQQKIDKKQNIIDSKVNEYNKLING